MVLKTQNRGDSEDTDQEISREDSDGPEDKRSDWKVIKDLVDIYDIFFEPRYMVSRSVSAHRHGDDVLGNLI